MANESPSIDFKYLSSEEKIAFSEKASHLLGSNTIDEMVSICKQIPLTSLLVR